MFTVKPFCNLSLTRLFNLYTRWKQMLTRCTKRKNESNKSKKEAHAQRKKQRNTAKIQ